MRGDRYTSYEWVEVKKKNYKGWNFVQRNHNFVTDYVLVEVWLEAGEWWAWKTLSAAEIWGPYANLEEAKRMVVLFYEISGELSGE